MGRPRYRDLDNAIDLLEETFRRYYHLIYGSCSTPLVALHEYDVAEDLEKIWPKHARGSRTSTHPTKREA